MKKFLGSPKVKGKFVVARKKKLAAQNRATLMKMNQYTMEQRLFHELHNKSCSISIKEFKEAYAFVEACRKMFGKETFDLVVDVAGGHGALAGLFLAVNVAHAAVVVDPADVGGGSVQRAWEKYLTGKSLRYRHEALHTGLPEELCWALQNSTKPERILVVACHACQHLSDEILEIAIEFGVNAAVMPCCQRDLSNGYVWKAASKNLGIRMEIVMDLLLAGKTMSWSVGKGTGVAYDVRLKVLDKSSTPQNRLILCRVDAAAVTRRKLAIERAQHQLEKAYHRAHKRTDRRKMVPSLLGTSMIPLIGSFFLGIALATIALRR